MTNHYPTCEIWQTGIPSDCNCAGEKPWQIKKIEDGGDHPWLISRRMGPDYEPFLACRSHKSALSLVDGMIWLTREGLRR